MATLSQLEGLLDNPGAPESGNVLESIRDEYVKTAKALGMVMGMYRPKNAAEASELRRRAISEGVFTVLSAVGTAGAGTALKAASPALRVALAGMAGGALGGAGAAAVEEADPITGALIGGGLGALPGLGMAARRASRGAGAAIEAAAEPAVESAGRVAREAGEGLLEPLSPAASRQAMRMARRARAEVGFGGNRPDDIRFAPEPNLQEGAPLELAAPIETAMGAGRQRTAMQRRLFGRPDVSVPPERPPFTSPEPNLIDDAAPDLKGQPAATQEAAVQLSLPDVSRGTPSPLQGTRTILRIRNGEVLEDVARNEPRMRARREMLDRDPTDPTELVKGIFTNSLDPDISRARAMESFKAFLMQERRAARLPKRSPAQRAAAFRRRLRAIEQPETPDQAALHMGAAARTADAIAEQFSDNWAVGRSGWNDAKKLYHRAITGAGSYLEKLGPAGQALRQGMERADEAFRLRASADLSEFDLATRHLSNQELELVADVLEGAIIDNARVNKAAEATRRILDVYRDDALGLGIRMQSQTGTRGFEPMKNFFPHELPADVRKALSKPGSRKYDETIGALAGRTGLSRQTVESMVKRVLLPASEFRAGSLQHARDLILPVYEKNVRKVIPGYIIRSAQRLEQARMFGPTDRIGWELVKEIADDGGDWKSAGKIFNAFLDHRAQEYSGLAKIGRDYAVLSMLSTAGILQPAQLVNTAAREGYTNMLRGLAAIMKREGRDWATGTGATLSNMIDDIVPEGTSSIAGKWVRIIGLKDADRINRLVSAMAGRFNAEGQARKLLQRPDSAAARRELARLGINADEVLANRGLNEAQLRVAGLRAANQTQFRGSSLDLPEMRNTPQGQFLYLFKSFALQQGRFVKDLVKDARAGNPAPLLRYAAGLGTVGAAVGEGVFAFRTVIGRGRERPEEPFWRWVEDMLYVGALGVATDAVRAMQSGPEAVASFLSGPVGGETLSLMGRDIPALAGGNPVPVLNKAVKRIPMLGPAIADWIFQ